jgi:hypothetical protein
MRGQSHISKLGGAICASAAILAATASAGPLTHEQAAARVLRALGHRLVDTSGKPIGPHAALQRLREPDGQIDILHPSIGHFRNGAYPHRSRGYRPPRDPELAESIAQQIYADEVWPHISEHLTERIRVRARGVHGLLRVNELEGLTTLQRTDHAAVDFVSAEDRAAAAILRPFVGGLHGRIVRESRPDDGWDLDRKTLMFGFAIEGKRTDKEPGIYDPDAKIGRLGSRTRRRLTITGALDKLERGSIVIRTTDGVEHTIAQKSELGDFAALTRP